ncbi:MAG: KH domain-containing protein [Clostridia bacterium]|nr:KH domain-containing protein [Clostridia bacterium]
MKELVEYLVNNLVDDTEGISIEEKERGNFVDLIITVPQGEMGKIIGKQGRIAKAIRSVVKAASSKLSKKYNVEICEKK